MYTLIFNYPDNIQKTVCFYCKTFEEVRVKVLELKSMGLTPKAFKKEG